MLTWLKKLFGSDIPDTPVIAQEVKEETVTSTVGKVTEVKSDIPAKTSKPKASTKKTTKKSAPKKAEAVDLDSMNKTQLLEEAKKRGVKANASLKKEEILERIKNG